MDLPSRTLDVLLIRHGETDANRLGIVQGQSQVPLNALGLAQARELAGHLSGFSPRIDMLISSDLARAMQTAGTIAEALGLPVRADRAWRERGMGELEGQRTDIWSAVTEKLPRGCESLADFETRVRRAFLRLGDLDPGVRTVGVVTHGGVLWHLVRMLVEGDLALEPGHPPIEPGEAPNCSLTHLHATESRTGWRWRVPCLSDATFLSHASDRDAG